MFSSVAVLEMQRAARTEQITGCNRFKPTLADKFTFGFWVKRFESIIVSLAYAKPTVEVEEAVDQEGGLTGSVMDLSFKL